MKTKLCWMVGNLQYSSFFEAAAKFLDQEKYELSFIFLSPGSSPLQRKLARDGFGVRSVKFRRRSDILGAFREVSRIFQDLSPDIVHTHLVDPSIVGLGAALRRGIRRRVHTRHHSTEAHTFYPHGVYYDRLVNKLSLKIIATTETVKRTLVEREGVRNDKVTVINLGYDFRSFSPDPSIIQSFKAKYGLVDAFPVVGVISRFVEGKGIQYTIPAFARLAAEFPHARLILANAEGNYSLEIDELLSKHLKPEQYVKIGFEPDVVNLYKTFDVFAHVPINSDYEAFGQTYVEALYLGVPSVVTLSGVAHDIIEHRQNAMVVGYRDSDAIFQAFKELICDSELRDSIVRRGRLDTTARFAGEVLANNLDKFYSDL